MELQRKETKEMLDDLTTRDQRMMFGLVTLVHLADSKRQLDSDTETLLSVGRKHLCQLSTLRWQQRDGLDTVLPYGVRRIPALRTLTTESTAVLIPFRAQEIMQAGGIYYGQNAVSKTESWRIGGFCSTAIRSAWVFPVPASPCLQKRKSCRSRWRPRMIFSSLIPKVSSVT